MTTYYRVVLRVPVEADEGSPEGWDYNSLLDTINPVLLDECEPVATSEGVEA